MSSRNVIILTPDCLRAAESDLLGGIRKQVDLAVNQCYASGTWTLPSHASLLSGFPVCEHNVTRRGDRFSFELANLPRNARQNGYRTALVSENPTFGSETRFDSGMDIVDEDVHVKRFPGDRSPLQDIEQKSLFSSLSGLKSAIEGEETLRNIANVSNAVFDSFRASDPSGFPHHGQRVLNHLSYWVSRKEPLFAIANVLDTHNPHYRPPDGYRSEIDISDDEIRALKAANDNQSYLLGESLPAEAQSRFQSWDDVQQRMHDVYRAQVTFLNDIVSEWLRRNERMLSKSLVVIVGDHGQLFGDEGMVGHHTSLHPHGIMVPAFVSFPETWSRPAEPTVPLSMTGLSKVINGVIEEEITTANEFVERWSQCPVITCVDGPTWRISTLREEYDDHPRIDELRVRKIGIVEGDIQTVHSVYWDEESIETATFEITMDRREEIDVDPAELSSSQKRWLQGGGDSETREAEISERLKALGYK